MLNKFKQYFVGLSALLGTPLVMASDGTITFTGTIINSACTISSVAGTNGKDGTVAFGTYYTAQSFPSANPNNTSIAKPFMISLTNCTVGAIPTIGYQTADTIDTSFPDLFPTGIVGYGIKIVDSGNTSVVYTPNTYKSNTGFSMLSVPTTSSNPGQADLNFTAYLVRFATTAGTGTFTKTVNFQINYGDL